MGQLKSCFSPVYHIDKHKEGYPHHPYNDKSLVSLVFIKAMAQSAPPCSRLCSAAWKKQSGRNGQLRRRNKMSVILAEY